MTTLTTEKLSESVGAAVLGADPELLAADDDVAGHEARRLARRHAVGGLG